MGVSCRSEILGPPLIHHPYSARMLVHSKALFPDPWRRSSPRRLCPWPGAGKRQFRECDRPARRACRPRPRARVSERRTRPVKPILCGVAASVWWSWTATANGRVQVDTIGSSFDTELEVSEGRRSTRSTILASNDESGVGTTSLLSFSAVAGHQYWITVTGWLGYTGAISLQLSAGPSITSPLTAEAESWHSVHLPNHREQSSLLLLRFGPAVWHLL